MITKHVVVLPYDEGWKQDFLKIKQELQDTLVHVINNMASSITGMICDGGNQGCTMKGIAACNTAFDACEFAMNGISIGSVHGINGNTPEETMRNMGMIASPGMVETEKTIVRIQQMKFSSKYE